MRKESELLSQNNSKLKKVILIDEETLKALMEGKRVEGAIRKTQDGLVSVPKAMGMNRAAILLADQSTEITDYLYDRGNKVEGGLIEFV